MFTGLIEEIGTVSSLKRSGTGVVLTVKSRVVLDGVRTGDSIAIDGACQTVVAFDDSTFSVFVSEVTAEITTLSSLKAGAFVNLERAMSAQGRFGGHMVQGHVDGKGSVLSARRDESGLRLRVGCAPALMRHVIPKGSVCVNGVSLTVVSEDQNAFELYLIPETIGRTNLQSLAAGDDVNIETDLIAKYLEKLVCKNEKAGNDASLLSALAQNGFI